MENIDITSEEYRVYTYDRGRYRIDYPISLTVTDSGSHRVVDASGFTHRPSTDWLGISWKPKYGEKSFVA